MSIQTIHAQRENQANATSSKQITPEQREYFSYTRSGERVDYGILLNEFVVQFKEGVTQEQIHKLNEKYQTSIINTYHTGGNGQTIAPVYVLSVPTGKSLKEMLRSYSGKISVHRALPGVYGDEPIVRWTMPVLHRFNRRIILTGEFMLQAEPNRPESYLTRLGKIWGAEILERNDEDGTYRLRITSQSNRTLLNLVSAYRNHLTYNRLTHRMWVIPDHLSEQMEVEEPEKRLYWYQATLSKIHLKAKPDEFVVQFKEGVTQTQIDQLNSRYGVTILKKFERELEPIYILSLPEGKQLRQVIKPYPSTKKETVGVYGYESIVEWTMPSFVYRDAPYLGHRNVPTDEFAVLLEPGAAKKNALLAFNRQHGVQIVRHDESELCYYQMRVTEASDMHSLDMANLYHEQPFTKAASPNYLNEAHRLKAITAPFVPFDPAAREHFIYTPSGQAMPYEVVSDEFVVQFKEEVTQEQIDRLNAAHQIQHLNTFRKGDNATALIHLMRIPEGGNLKGILKSYSQESEATSGIYGENPLVAWTMPVLQHRWCKLRLILTNEFRVLLEMTTPEEALLQLNEARGVEILERDTQKRAYRLRVTSQSKSHSLDMANLYHEHPFIAWATPDYLLIPKVEAPEARQYWYNVSLKGDEKCYLEAQPDEFTVQFKQGVTQAQIDQLNSKYGITIIRKVNRGGKTLPVYILSVPQEIRLKDVLKLYPQKKEEVHNVYGYEPIVAWTMPSFYYSAPHSRGYREVPTDEFTVMLKPNVSKEILLEFNKQHGIEIIRNDASHSYWHRHYLMRVTSESDLNSLDMANLYHEQPFTEYANPNYLSETRKAYAIPNDDEFNEQWNLHQENEAHDAIDIDAPEAWDISKGDNIIIAIIDTGIDMAHEDLSTKYILTHYYDFWEEDQVPHDTYGHGTAVSGIAAAATNNHTGIAGVAWKSDIMPLRISDDNTFGYTDKIRRAFGWAVDEGAKVINCSWGGLQPHSDIEIGVRYASENNCIVICAAGNEGTSNPAYPADCDYPGVMKVGAVIQDGTRWGGSNFNPDVVAPTDVLSTRLDGGYRIFGMTSGAAPHVSGLAALLLSYKSNLTPAQVKEIIEKTTDDRGSQGYNQDCGYGLINAFRALQYLGGTIQQGEVREWKHECKDPQKFDILLAGDVVIAEGATLRIKAGTVIRFEPKDYAYQEGGYSHLPEIIVKGKLEIEGTADDHVIFEGHTPEGIPSPAWYGIRFIDQAVPREIPNCEIRNAERALSFSGVGTPAEESTPADPFIVENCIIEGCSSDGIFIYQSLVTINNSKICNNDGNGIFVQNCWGVVDYVNINNCSIWGNAANGIKFINVCEGNPVDTSFAGNVSGCDIHHNGTGTNLQNCDRTGISLQSGEVKIRGCNIYDNMTYGVYSTQTGDFPDVWPNLGGEGEVNWGKNNIYGNGSSALYNDSFAHPIFAIGNYWGTNAPATVIFDHDVGGVVHFQPFRPFADGPFENQNVPVDIGEDATWRESEGDRTIAAEVTVMPEVTLTIEPGVTVNFAADSEAKLIVEGTLIANEVTFNFAADSEAKLIVEGILTANGVTFKSDADSPTYRDWEGIVLKGNDSRLTNCTITDAEYAVVCEGEAQSEITGIVIENCDISNCDSGIVVEYGVNITLHNNTVRTGGLNAIYCYESSDLTITENDVSSDGNSGINISRCHEGVLVENNKAHDNSWAGILVGSYSEATVNGNELYDNTVGLYLSSSSCLVNSTLIKSNATGIRVSGDSFLDIQGDGDFTSIGEKDKIQSNTGNGIHVYSDAIVMIRDYEIADNAGHGICTPNTDGDTNGCLNIVNCNIHDNGGNGIDTSCGTGLLYVSQCDIAYNEGHGISVSNVSDVPYVYIADSTIMRNVDGIHFDSVAEDIPIDSPGWCEIRGCNISYNHDDGIEIKDSKVRVHYNGIFYNEKSGVYIIGYSMPNLGDGSNPGENDIFSNTDRDLYNGTANNVNARGNYWGPDTPVIYGLVDIEGASSTPFQNYGEPTPPISSTYIRVGETLTNQPFKWDDNYYYHYDGNYCQYSCQLDAPTNYVITTTNASGGNTTDTYLYLLDRDGTVVARNDDGNGNHLSRIEYTPNDLGTFHIRLRACEKGMYGYCDLTLSSLAVTSDGAPTTPSISGSTLITAGSSPTYIASSSDAEGDSIRFEWAPNWEGSHIDPNWYSSPATGGIALIAPSLSGTYIVGSRARDNQGNVSPWGGLAITVESDDNGEIISVGETLTAELFEWNGSYSTRNDGTYCQYICQLNASTTYAITTTNASGGDTTDTYLYLLDGSYSLITSDDDGNGNLLSKIEFTPSYSGTFYIRLRAYWAGGYGYCDLALDVVPGVSGSISVGETLTGRRFEWQSDYSSRSDGTYCEYSCQLNASTDYVITTNSAILETTTDTYLYLLDSSYTVVAQNDDGNGNLLSKIEYTPSFSGTFHIRLRAFGQGTSGYCDLALAENSGDGTISVGETLTHQLFEWQSSYSTRSDGDYCQYSCQLNASTNYVITTTNAVWVTTDDTYLYLMDSSGSVIASDDDGNGNLLSRIEYTPSFSGTFHIRLRAFGQGMSGYCDLALEENSGEGGGTISVGETLTHQLFEWQSGYSTRSDGDYCQYSCQLNASTNYVITTTNASGGTTNDTYLYLLDSNGSVIVSDDDGNGNLLSRIQYTPSYSDTFYIRLRAYSQGTYGYCDLTLTW